MIECRTKGIPMRADVRVDADGFHVFTLDEGRRNPFEVLLRLMTSLGYEPPAADAKLDAVLRERSRKNEQEAIDARRVRAER